ncbi:MAG: UDP-galactopyranose mutase [Candidatus Pacearchaeota archaeon]
MKKYDFLIVGAGFSGAVLAERLANELDKKVLIIDQRDHIGGNCYDYKDENGILIKKYGPHIFHTSNEDVWKYINKFTKFNDYKHKVIAYYKGKYYPIPINLDTVNQFYGTNHQTEEELKKFLEEIRVDVENIENSRDVVVSRFGEELYEAFVKHYTKKQWDKYPHELDKTVLERLPIKYNKDPFYFHDPYQGMPENGYSEIFQKMLNHPNIDVRLNTSFQDIINEIDHDKLIFTGRIDEYFDFKHGKLDYRSIKFSFEEHDKEEYQPNSVVNHTDKESEVCRVTEYKKFYDTKSNKTVICKEIFDWDSTIAYPMPDKKNKELVQKYIEEAENLKNIYFAGRLGKYKYFNMDKVIEDSLELFKKIKDEEVNKEMA